MKCSPLHFTYFLYCESTSFCYNYSTESDQFGSFHLCNEPSTYQAIVIKLLSFAQAEHFPSVERCSFGPLIWTTDVSSVKSIRTHSILTAHITFNNLFRRKPCYSFFGLSPWKKGRREVFPGLAWILKIQDLPDWRPILFAQGRAHSQVSGSAGNTYFLVVLQDVLETLGNAASPKQSFKLRIVWQFSISHLFFSLLHHILYPETPGFHHSSHLSPLVLCQPVGG